MTCRVGISTLVSPTRHPRHRSLFAYYLSGTLELVLRLWTTIQQQACEKGVRTNNSRIGTLKLDLLDALMHPMIGRRPQVQQVYEPLRHATFDEAAGGRTFR